MRARVLLPCLLCIFALLSVQIVSFPSDGSDIVGMDSTTAGDELSDIIIDVFTYGGERDPASQFRADMVSLLSMAISVKNGYEEKVGGKEEISGAVEVKSGSVYDMDQGKEYCFTDSGSINVRNGGTLRLGTSFNITGGQATVHMDKGSSLVLLGKVVTVSSDTTMVLKGMLTSDITVVGELNEVSMNASYQGSVDLKGTLYIADCSIEGNDGADVEMDLTVRIELDPESEIRDLRYISEEMFLSDNGISFEFEINKLKMNVDTSILGITASFLNSKVKMSSPIGSDILYLDGMDAMKMSADMLFHVSSMDAVHFLIQGANTESNGTIYVSDLEIEVKTLKDTLFRCNLSTAGMSLSVGESVSLTVYRGHLNLGDGSAIMDLDIYGNVRAYMMDVYFYGNFHASSDTNLSGFLNLPFSADTHCVIDGIADMTFAEDEKAYLQMFTDMNYQTLLYPAYGYKLLEMTSPEYVSYEIDEYLPSAVPSSLFGKFHSEVEIRDLELTIGDEVLAVKAFETVNLPVPEPIEGMTFVGWSDGFRTYTDTYTMPYHEMTLIGTWSENNYAPKIDSKVYTITVQESVAKIRDDTMDDVRSLMNDGKVDTLKVNTSKGIIELSKGAVLGTEGGIMVNLAISWPYEVPQYESIIWDGILYSIWITDSNGLVTEPEGPIKITAPYDKLKEMDNHVTVYTMSELGRLKKIDSSATFEDDVAMVTVDYDVLPFFVVKSSHVKEVQKVSTTTIVVAFIPVVVVGIVLAAITRKY